MRNAAIELIFKKGEVFQIYKVADLMRDGANQLI